MPGINLELLKTHNTDWQASQAQVALNARLDGRIVASATSPGGARVAYSHVAVLDGFFDEGIRQQMLAQLTEAGWDHTQGPPESKWERATADGAGLARTWGLTHQTLRALSQTLTPAMLEVHSRLAKLYPDHSIAHMPADSLQLNGEQSVQGASTEAAENGHGVEEELEEAAGSADGSSEVHCDSFVGNAAVHGDDYTWHVDADPSDLPLSTPWVDALGLYCNGEPGKPLLVSLLLYLNDAWPRDWDAETLFLDGDTDIGLVVRPKRYRAVLMDQDVLHRLSAPSSRAGSTPRYSLVWKLVFLPKHAGQTCCIARAQWGRPTDLGSAAKLQQVKAALAKRARGE